MAADVATFLLLVSRMKTQNISLVGAALFVLGTAACHKNPQKPAEGPLERAGKHVDNAAERTKDAAKDVKDDTKDAVKDVKRDLQKPK